MKTLTWLGYSLAFFLLPAALGILSAFGTGSGGALIGICSGLAIVFASIGWTLRR
jgi:hypothetical protein